MLMAMLFASFTFAQDLEKGLVAYWKFNALEFDGAEDEVNIPYDAAVNPGTFTICLT